MQLPPVDRLPYWRLQADETPSGGNGAAAAAAAGAAGVSPPVRPLQAPLPLESMERLGQGAVPRTPDVPSAPETPNRDWTDAAVNADIPKPPEPPPPPPPEPISKQLLEFFQSMWRASGSVVDIAQDIEKPAQAERLAQQARNEPLTYSDYSNPKVKRPDGV